MKKLNLFKVALLALMPLLLAPGETSAQIITNFAGGGGTPGDGGQATAAQLAGPRGVCQDASGNTYIIEQFGNKLRKVATDGIITTIAGSSSGFSGDGGPAAAAQFAQPLAVAADVFGNLYIADFSNRRIRKINSSGIISTIAGGGASTADGVAATNSNVRAYGLTTDIAGNVYVADAATNRIRKINVTTGIITTVAGNGSTTYTGEGLAATASAVNFPIGVAFDAAGNMYIAQYSGQRVSKVDLAGIMTTVAGTGTLGYNGEGLAVTKNLNYPSAVSVDVAGNIYIVDLSNSRIRKVNDGMISTIGGNGVYGDGGDGGPATDATLGTMYGIYVDGSGSIYLPELNEQRVRKIAGSLCTPPIISAGSSVAICSGSSTVLTATGGTTYSWSPSAGLSATTGSAVTASPSVNTTYTVTGTTSGCSSTATVQVSVNPTPVNTFTVTPNPVCSGIATTFTSGELPCNLNNLKFNGNSTAVRSGVLTTATNNITMEAWVKWDGTLAPKMNIMINGSTGGNGYELRLNNGAVTCDVGSVSSFSGGTLTPNVWAHIALVRNAGAWEIYINGVAQGIVASLNPNTPTGNFWIGSGAAAAVEPARYFRGEIDEVKFWNIPRTAAQILADMNECNTPHQAGLLGYWRFDEGTGSTTADASGNNFNLSLTNTTWMPASTLLPSYHWNFGDGVSTTVNTRNVAHTYTAGAVYTPSLTVTNLNGCSNTGTAIVTVNATATAGTISGTDVICQGTNTALSATGGASGGVWSSTNMAAATVSASGVVSGIAGGNTIISYTVVNDCGPVAATFAMTVNPLPSLAPISGPAAVCAGSTISLSSSAGGVWSSSDNTKATVDASGVVTGITPSPVTISYAAANSCGSSLVVYGIVVNATPSTISGPSTVCAGTLITLTNTPGGGTWSSPDATVSVVASNGKVTGITVGTALISYSTGAGCVATTIVSVTAGPGAIGGTIALCPGATTALSNGTTGGTWSSSTTARATVDASTGVVTAISSGVTYITYSLGAGCYNTVALTVNPAPNPITGPLAICPSSTADLHSTTTGGVWSSDNTTVATVNSATGLVTSVAGTGTTTISYVVGATCPRSVVVTVAATSPNVGTPIVCMGQPFSVAVLTNATPGGTWSSSDPLKVPINNTTGVLKGLSAGTVTITYQLGSGCLSTSVLTVNPAIPVITGPVALCPGSAALYTNSTVGGTWSSSNTTVATVGTSGTVAGILEGTTTISYIVNEGCYKTTDVTVNGGMADITGADEICAGSTTTLSSGPSGGTWSSGHPTATINMTTGLLTGVTAGTAMITYRNGSSGCYVNKQVSINAAVATITGTANICPGFSTTLSNTDAGGAWSSSNMAVATVNASGAVTGISSGTAIITYMTTPACYQTTIQTIKLAPSPIGGTTDVCQNATTTLTSGPAGGVWSSSNTANATISTAGVIRGITPGVTTIQYLLSSGCLVTQDVAINGLPDAITGITSVCVNATTALTSAPSGGTWTSSNLVKAAVDATSGVLTGVSAGTTNVTYTLPSGCYVKTTATTKAPPAAITGTTTVAPGFAVILYCTPGGGTWSSADPSIASFNPATGGRVNGVATGVVTVTYTIPSTGCFSTTNVTVTGAARPGYETSISGDQKMFNIFPNPSQGVLNVETSVNGTFAVFTIDGRQVASYNITTTSTTLSLPGDLAAGMYMCRFTGEDGSNEMVRLVYER